MHPTGKQRCLDVAFDMWFAMGKGNRMRENKGGCKMVIMKGIPFERRSHGHILLQ